MRRIVFAFALLLAATPVRAEEPSAGRFKENSLYLGMNTNMLWGDEYARALVPTGARWVRVSQTCAPHILKKPGEFDWTEPDKAVKALDVPTGDPIRLNALALLGYAPGWAAPQGARAGNFGTAYQSIDEPWDSPANVYGDYVFKIVSRYKDRVKYWQPWNEPDLPGHIFFAGDGREWAKYQKVAYLNAKKADPMCVVTFPSMTHGNIEGYWNVQGLKAPTPTPEKTSFFADYLDEVNKDQTEWKFKRYYFDIMTQNCYSRAAAIYDYAETDRRIMAAAGASEKPIWITEMGVEVGGGPFAADTHQEYCDYEIQAHVYGKMAGVHRVFHFQLDDTNKCGLYFEVPAKPKPAFFAYKDIVARFIAPARFVKLHHGRLGTGVLEGKDIFQDAIVTGYVHAELETPGAGQRIHVLWADGPEPAKVSVPAKGAKAALLGFDRKAPDADQNPAISLTAIAPAKGAYEVVLAPNKHTHGWPKAKPELGKPEYSIGGPTVVIVEPPPK